MPIFNKSVTNNALIMFPNREYVLRYLIGLQIAKAINNKKVSI